MRSRSESLNQVYLHYRDWRRSYPPISVEDEKEIFRHEFARISPPRNARILEVGFGEGSFLNWARESGYRVEGIEISADYVETARNQGHAVYLGTIEAVSLPDDAQYDVIVCFDVLEHMDETEIVEFFQLSKRILRHDGVILARFPNGGSPFGRLHQHGDATHLTTLTALKVDQLAFAAGLRVTDSFNAARPFERAKFFGLRPRFYYMLGVITEWMIGKMFYTIRQPLDPNLVVHVRHRRA